MNNMSCPRNVDQGSSIRTEGHVKGEKTNMKVFERKNEKKSKGFLNDTQYEEMFAVVLAKSALDSLPVTTSMTDIEECKYLTSTIRSGTNTLPSVDGPKGEVAHGSSESLLEIATIKYESEQGRHQEQKRFKSSKLSLKTKRKEGDGNSELKQQNKKCPCKGKTPNILEVVTEITDNEETGDATTQLSQFVAWVQCSQENCMKWRRLDGAVDPLLLPDDWTCDQNTDALFNSCVIPEDTWSGCENEIIYATFIPGSLVWAKQFGYPWWPAMVDTDPDIAEYFVFENEMDQLPAKYHVTFLGATNSRAWIIRSLLKPFQNYRPERLGVHKVKNREIKKKLAQSIEMAHSALSMDIKRAASPGQSQEFGFEIER